MESSFLLVHLVVLVEEWGSFLSTPSTGGGLSSPRGWVEHAMHPIGSPTKDRDMQIVLLVASPELYPSQSQSCYFVFTFLVVLFYLIVLFPFMLGNTFVLLSLLYDVTFIIIVTKVTFDLNFMISDGCLSCLKCILILGTAMIFHRIVCNF